MTASQSVQLYQIRQEHFGKNEHAARAVSAIEAIIDEKVDGGNKRYETLLHKDLEILRAEVRSQISDLGGSLRTEMREQKSELLKTIYVVGLVQFLAIVGSVIGIISFMLRH